MKPFIGFEVRRFAAASTDTYRNEGCTYSYAIETSGALCIYAEWPKKKGLIVFEHDREAELVCIYSASAWSLIVPIYDDKESRQAA
jgi:hypothetical protein